MVRVAPALRPSRASIFFAAFPMSRASFNGLQACGEFRFVLGNAVTVESLGNLVVFGLERLHFLFQFGIAGFQALHAGDQFSSSAGSGGAAIVGVTKPAATRAAISGEAFMSVPALLADADVGELVFQRRRA